MMNDEYEEYRLKYNIPVFVYNDHYVEYRLKYNIPVFVYNTSLIMENID